ncbi:MAG: hypothetical protein LBE12_02090 [Planctomycetaceae bacterium]|nr:hypothetical protein [Planctomycetaceae bacterium]
MNRMSMLPLSGRNWLLTLYPTRWVGLAYLALSGRRKKIMAGQAPPLTTGFTP